MKTSRIILDTCIYIDILRGRPEALALIRALDSRPGVSVVTVMELFWGARSAREEAHIENLMNASRVLALGPEIARQAGVNLKHYHKSYHIDVPDAIIAATAQWHDLALATLNIRHFPMFKNLKPAYGPAGSE